MQAEPFSPKPRKKRPPRETGRYGTEQSGKDWVKTQGGVSRKWVSPGHGGVPDQIELYGVEHMLLEAGRRGIVLLHEDAVALLAAAIQFTEYKAPSREPTANQLTNHRELRERGFTVNVVDWFRMKESR